MGTYILIITFHAKPGKREAYVKALEESGVLADIRAEEGCIRYDYFFPADGSDDVLLVEEWTDKAHQQVHLTQPHMEKARVLKPDYITSQEMVTCTRNAE